MLFRFEQYFKHVIKANQSFRLKRTVLFSINTLHAVYNVQSIAAGPLQTGLSLHMFELHYFLKTISSKKYTLFFSRNSMISLFCQ